MEGELAAILILASIAVAISAQAPVMAPAENEEVFKLLAGRCKYVLTGGKEVIITYEGATGPDDVGVTCSVDGKVTTGRFKVGDVILGLPGCRITLENLVTVPGGEIYIALFKVSGYFTIKTWTIMTVDSEGDVGCEPKIALDSKGYPHIAYNHWERRDLKYARWTGSWWEVETVDWEWSVGRCPSLALDAHDRPHISYWDTINVDLKYARWDGEKWRIERVDSEGHVGFCASMALDGRHRPHIAYWDRTSHWLLKYAFWTGEGWEFEMVDNLGVTGHAVGLEISIRVDGGGRPRISYIAENPAEGYYLLLKYAERTGDGWRVEVVDDKRLSYRWVNMVLDNRGCPHIVYYADMPLVNGYSPGEVMEYARWTGAEWRFEVIDNLGGTPPGPSIALDSEGRPHIAYFGPGLEYVRWTGTGWEFQRIEWGWKGLDASIVLDEKDLPHIAYHDGDEGDLKYATLSEAIKLEPRPQPVGHKVAAIVIAVAMAAAFGIFWRGWRQKQLPRPRS